MHVTEGPFRQSAPVWAGTVDPDGPYEIRDGAATDTTDLLLAAGLDADAVQALSANGVIA